jgi:glycerol transport system ATP-binding protein
MLELRDITLGSVAMSHTFPGGAISVVLGRNRSGKTRLCRMIAGLEPAGGGSILIDGEDVSHTAPGARSTALVYQAFVNYPNLTVFENIASPLRARRLDRAEIRRRVTAIAERLQLAGLLERLPAQLSGGQQQRLAIGRALAKSARVLILDEPLVNLDYKLREALEHELREMLHAEGLTVIYTTSDPRDAFNLGDRVVLLEDHRIVQSGVPLDVYQHPASAAAADLMSDPGVNRFRDGAALCVVRPEHLSLVSDTRHQRAFELGVLSVETNGSETYLHGIMAEDHWVAKLQGLHRVRAGERVTVYAPSAAVLRFDGAVHG